jgi:hypothetical protein
MLLSLAAVLTWAAMPSPVRAAADHSDLDRILRSVVRDGKVDYAGLRREHLPALRGYLEYLHAEPSGQGNERLAYLINLYNASVLAEVAARYRPGFSPAEDDFRMFKAPNIRFGNAFISLDDLEHKFIRPVFKDPRVHAALNCAAESCPPLLPRAYREEDLDQVLDENMKRFVNDPIRNPIDVKNRKLVVSKIFEWYADDFGGKDKIAAYIDKYHDADVSGWPVSFVEYSWKLNDATASK